MFEELTYASGDSKPHGLLVDSYKPEGTVHAFICNGLSAHFPVWLSSCCRRTAERGRTTAIANSDVPDRPRRSFHGCSTRTVKKSPSPVAAARLLPQSAMQPLRGSRHQAETAGATNMPLRRS